MAKKRWTSTDLAQHVDGETDARAGSGAREVGDALTSAAGTSTGAGRQIKMLHASFRGPLDHGSQ